jgi:hypothetical protein
MVRSFGWFMGIIAIWSFLNFNTIYLSGMFIFEKCRMPFGQDDEEEHQRVSSIEDTPSTADESGSKAVSVRNSATARISSLAGRPSAGEGREGSQTAGVSVNHRNSNEAAATTSAGRTEAAEKEKRFSWFVVGTCVDIHIF